MQEIRKLADKVACDLIMYPTDKKYTDEHIREFQGCPTIAATKGGRLYLGWYAGGTREPHMDNFNLVIFSDDGGKSWSSPLFVIPSSRENNIHALDIQLFTAPDGRLFVFWVQNNTHPAGTGEKNTAGTYLAPYVEVDGTIFDDFLHSMWVSVCDDPDADKPMFSEPRCVSTGFLRCKPLVTSSGRWLCFNYDQMSDRYGYTISDDNGETFVRHTGPKKVPTSFDESMAYEKKDGSIRMLARTNTGELGETTSRDGGLTWEDAKESGIGSPDTRFYISRTPSGRLLLINNDSRQGRKNMTLYLSEDDGATWKYKRCVDTRNNISYPDADFHDGKIYLSYDRERTGAKEILFAAVTEEDIIDPTRPIDVRVISKP